MNHAYGRGETFTIGLEEELLLVDGETLQLDHSADRVIEAMELPFERGGHEAFLAEVEVRSDPQACLLYTSPSPRDGLLSRMPSSA